MVSIYDHKNIRCIFMIINTYHKYYFIEQIKFIYYELDKVL